MDRKLFLQKSLGLILLSTGAISLINCSSSDEDETPAAANGGQGSVSGNCLDNGTTSSIGSNHGHTVTVSKADVESGAEKTYDIQGTSGHPHTIRVTTANFNDLKANKSITVTSSTDDSHTHSVTISCA